MEFRPFCDEICGHLRGLDFAGGDSLAVVHGIFKGGNVSRYLLLGVALLFLSVGIVEAGPDEPGPVPEPFSAVLLASGIAGLGIRAYRKRRRQQAE